MSNTNARNEALTKLKNLATALADCGITSELLVYDDEISLNVNIWNCDEDPTTETFEIWAVKETGYAIES